MTQYTSRYQLPYYEEDDVTSGIIERRRAVTVDNQLWAFASIFGNGVIEGWYVEAGDGLSVVVSSGQGLLLGWAASTSMATVVSGLDPNRDATSPNYIYVAPTATTPHHGDVEFGVSTDGIVPTGALLLATVTTDATSVTAVDNSVKETIELLSDIAREALQHIHVGGDDNPPPIDLVSHVTGRLAAAMIESIDASQITSGQIPAERLPRIAHDSLLHAGELTHEDIDRALAALAQAPDEALGNPVVANFLRLILALAANGHGAVADSLINSRFYIPGIIGDGLVDNAHTTAAINTTEHYVEGQPGSAAGGVLLALSGERLESEAQDSSDVVYVDGSGLTLETETSTTDVTVATWQDAALAEGASHSPPAHDFEPTLTAVMYGAPDPSDWSAYDMLRIRITTTDTEHRPLYFYFVNNGTTQGPYLLLDANELANDTVKEVDISAADRDAVDEIGFLYSVPDGATAAGIDFTLHGISLCTTPRYAESGWASYLIHTSATSHWDTLMWTATVPSGCAVTARTRSADTLEALGSMSFSESLDSGDSIPSAPGQYLEVRIFLQSSADRLAAPTLSQLTVAYTTPDAAQEINLSGTWDEGVFINAAAEGAVGSQVLTVASVERIGTYFSVPYTSSTQPSVLCIDSSHIIRPDLQLSPQWPPVPGDATRGLLSVAHVRWSGRRSLLIADSGHGRLLEVGVDGTVSWTLQSPRITYASDLELLAGYYSPDGAVLALVWSRPLSGDANLAAMRVIHDAGEFLLSVAASETVQIASHVTAVRLRSTYAQQLAASTRARVAVSADAAVADNGATNDADVQDLWIGDIEWLTIGRPLSLDLHRDMSRYLVCTDGSEGLGIFEYVPGSGVSWQWSDISISEDYLAAAVYDWDGECIWVADPDRSRIVQLSLHGELNDVIDLHAAPVYVTPDGTGNGLWATLWYENGETGEVVHLVDGDVVWAYGLGVLSRPRACLPLSDGRVLVAA